MEAPFLYAIKIVLGDRYTESMEEIYKVVIKFILNNVTDIFEEERIRQIKEDYLFEDEESFDT